MLKLNEISNKMKLIIESTDKQYFATYSGAVQYAKTKAEEQGFEILDQDWSMEIGSGEGKPGGDMPQLYDKTPVTRHNIPLYLNGKPYKKALTIVVSYVGYGKNSEYELLYYIN